MEWNDVQPGSMPPRAPRITAASLDSLMRASRRRAEQVLRPIVDRYYPAMPAASPLEYRKMIALTTKMAMVGMACTRVAGYPFDSRRARIACLYGACCFLGDSFLDDFGEEAAWDYLARYELLLTKGWFEIRSDRERLFYIVLARLFAERDILDPTLRQAIFGLYLAQKRDVTLRSADLGPGRSARRRRLSALRECARDRSGHAITLLSLLLVPKLPLGYHCHIYTAGSLIMHIDDHGDCYFDRHHRRLTYMNQVRSPGRALRAIFTRGVERIRRGLPDNEGRDLLIAFLNRYYATRLRKHRLERRRGEISWTVYE